MLGRPPFLSDSVAAGYLVSDGRANLRRLALPVVALVLAVPGVGLGSLCLVKGNWADYAALYLVLACVGDLLLFANAILSKKGCAWKLLLVSGAALLSALVVSVLPPTFFGLNINGVIHRSFVAGVLMLSVSTTNLCLALYHVLGPTPKAKDIALYPVLVLPVALTLVAFGLIIYKLVTLGVPALDLQALTTQYISHSWAVQVWQDDWPVNISYSVQQAGISQFILRTFQLMLLTCIFSTPVGVGIGLFVTQFSRGRVAQTVRLATNSLRAISVFILGLLALSLVRFSRDTALAPVFCGFYTLENGRMVAGSGSFITASLVISLLVIPVIASAVEEGIRSLPPDLTEGSLAIGASHTYTITHILMPWVLPNLVTGLLIGCAEAAGSLAVIMFISGTSQYAITPFSQPTSLTVFIWHCLQDTSQSFMAHEGPYQYAAALLLVFITLGLSIAAILLKRHFSRRYRGA